MADVELVIKIPEITYNAILERKHLAICNDNDIYEWIKNGTLLPIGHGRLIDADEVNDAIHKCFEDIQFYDGTGYDIYSDSKESIDKISTIIEADKGDKK